MPQHKKGSTQVNCLGNGIFKGCLKKLWTTDPCNTRYCASCRKKKERIQEDMSYVNGATIEGGDVFGMCQALDKD
jgi:hypothetical protein